MLAFELEQNEMLSLFVKGLPLENLLISPCCCGSALKYCHCREHL